MTLKTRLAKLEGKCLWCQYSLRSLLPGEFKADFAGTRDLLATKCWFCGTRFGVSLVGQDKYEREVAPL